MNYMKEVAQMLGVELGEEFRVEGFDDKFMFTSTGMFYYDVEDSEWQESLLIYNILKGTRKIIKQPVLNEAEREYLRNIIKPFRDKVKTIIRLDYYYKSEYDFIQIEYDRDLGQVILKSDIMYNSMKLGKEYTLEELGL